jgi:hypothetical protein
MPGTKLHAGILLLALSSFANASCPVEVFEVNSTNTSELPQGKEADGIIGDFVLRNDYIEALVSGNLPERKANMGVMYDAPTPGCLYDLCLRDSGNDQMTYFGPGSLRGPLSFVTRISAEDNPLGVPGVQAVRSAAMAEGRGQRHAYLLGKDWNFLAILSTYHNETKEDWDLDPAPGQKGLGGRLTVHDVSVGNANNPSDKQAYAAAASEWTGALQLAEPAARRVLGPGEEGTYLTLIAPGRSPAEAFGIIAAHRGPVGRLRGRLRESSRSAVTSAVIEIPIEKKGGAKEDRILEAYPDASGDFDVALPPGKYSIRVRDLGRRLVEKRIEVRATEVTRMEIDFEPASKVAVEVTDGTGDRIPAKVQFIGVGETKDPVFGPHIQAHGCWNIYMSESGSFVQQVDPGQYRLVITCGIEFSHVQKTITVGAGKTVRVRAELERVVSTPGWVSTDFHNHSTPSGDNYCGIDDRVINLAVEQVEFAPTTEHNRLYDWTSHIKKLGLEEHLSTVPGIELTGPGAHFNAFPLKVVPFSQDNGAPRWQSDPRVNAIVLRDFQEGGPFRWVHLNHPRVGLLFGDRNMDDTADGGYPGLEYLIDAAEVWSPEILRLQARLKKVVKGKEREYENRTFAWLQLLNQGVRMNCIAVSDAHAVFGNSVGGWRTYVKSSEDEPSKLSAEEIIRNSKAGRMFVTTGPYIELQLDDGTEIGGSTVIQGPFHIEVKVQCTDWIDIDRVQVLVNGRPWPSLNFTRKSHADLFDGKLRFEHRIPIALQEDAHLIVAAVGEEFDLKTGYGKSTQGHWSPCAFTNPIYVDVDGHGWEANGDTLGFPLLSWNTR